MALKFPDGPFVDYENLLRQIEQAGNEGNVGMHPKYLKVVPQFELYYAPAPFKDIEWQLRGHSKSGSVEAQNQLNKLKAEILKHNLFGERDYFAYDDFVSKLKTNPEYSKSEEGFFSFYVGPKGLQHFDEKEVDTRIAVRTMDACYNYEVDSLCIVSSDQDFLPLHARAREFGIQSYQADLAKFQADDNIARKFKSLGSNFLYGQFKPIWPFKIIAEASNMGEDIPAFYTLTDNELAALCEMYNGMNDLHVSPHYMPDGTINLMFSKPAK